MIDMVRKHTIRGTGNHRTICDMLDRCKTMMYESKQISRTFVSGFTLPLLAVLDSYQGSSVE